MRERARKRGELENVKGWRVRGEGARESGRDSEGERDGEHVETENV